MPSIPELHRDTLEETVTINSQTTNLQFVWMGYAKVYPATTPKDFEWPPRCQLKGIITAYSNPLSLGPPPIEVCFRDMFPTFPPLNGIDTITLSITQYCRSRIKGRFTEDTITFISDEFPLERRAITHNPALISQLNRWAISRDEDILNRRRQKPDSL